MFVKSPEYAANIFLSIVVAYFINMMLFKTILIVYAAVALFVSGGLFFQHKSYAYRLLSLFVLLLGWEMIYFVYCNSPLLQLSSIFYGRFYFESGFLYGPLLWFHLQFFLNNKQSFVRADAWHLLPFLLAFLYYFDIAILPGEARLQYTSAHFSDRIMPLNYARALHQLVYGVLLVSFVRQRQSWMDTLKKTYTYAIVGIYFLTSILISGLTAFAGGWDDFVYYYLIIATLVFMIGFLLYRHPTFLMLLSKKYLHSSIDQIEMKQIKQKIRQSLQTQQLFLNSKLTLKLLAQQIEEKPHHLSQTFTLCIKESFNDHVNKYRVAHAQAMLKSPDFQHFTIEAIALDSGFNNKMTFNKSFQKFTGMKPSAFRLHQSINR